MSMLTIASAAIVGIPLFVVAIATAPVVALLSIPPLFFLVFRIQEDGTQSSTTLPDQVIIAGGSSGIGLAIAQECVARGVPKITLLARNLTKLQAVQAELQAMSDTEGGNKHKNNNKKKKSQIDIASVSVADYEAIAKVANDMKIPKTDRVVLWNCAGFVYPTEFEKVPIAKFEEQVTTNQLGTMYLVRAFLPHLQQGCIVLTSSVAGQLGVYGYATYAPTKYAIRGFADALHAELIRSHPKLSIQLAFPVDTDTPGYQLEQKVVPAITKKLSETGGIVSAEKTAKSMVNAAFCKNPKFFVYFTFEGWMLSNVTAGMSPVTNLADAVTQVALSGILRVIGLFILNDWWNTIRTFPADNEGADASSSKKSD